jgi:hypothetical protein
VYAEERQFTLCDDNHGTAAVHRGILPVFSHLEDAMALEGKYQIQLAQDAFLTLWRSKTPQSDESVTDFYRAFVLFSEGVKMALDDIHKHVGGTP